MIVLAHIHAYTVSSWNRSSNNNNNATKPFPYEWTLIVGCFVYFSSTNQPSETIYIEKHGTNSVCIGTSTILLACNTHFRANHKCYTHFLLLDEVVVTVAIKSRCSIIQINIVVVFWVIRYGTLSSQTTHQKTKKKYFAFVYVGYIAEFTKIPWTWITAWLSVCDTHNSKYISTVKWNKQKGNAKGEKRKTPVDLCWYVCF